MCSYCHRISICYPGLPWELERGCSVSRWNWVSSSNGSHWELHVPSGVDVAGNSFEDEIICADLKDKLGQSKEKWEDEIVSPFTNLNLIVANSSSCLSCEETGLASCISGQLLKIWCNFIHLYNTTWVLRFFLGMKIHAFPTAEEHEKISLFTCIADSVISTIKLL